jgi:hypothetical protein
MLIGSDMAISILLEPNTIRDNPLPMLNSMFHNIPLIPHHPPSPTSRTKRRPGKDEATKETISIMACFLDTGRMVCFGGSCCPYLFGGCWICIGCCL